MPNELIETKQETQVAEIKGKIDIQNALLELTANPNIDPERLEKFMQLQERWESREAEKAFHEALANFQGECPIIEKIKKGHQSKYAPLEHLVINIKPLLCKHGLAFYFDTEQRSETETDILTTIAHKNGHFKTSRYTFNTVDDGGKMNASQRRKSSLSYARRAGLENALGIVTKDEDDDAYSAHSKPMTDAQNKKLHALINETNTDRDQVKAYFKLESMKDMNFQQAQEAINMLETKKANRGTK